MLINGIIDLNPFILVKKATISWNNDKKMISPGYWTFSMLKKEVESYSTVSLQVVQ